MNLSKNDPKFLSGLEIFEFYGYLLETYSVAIIYRVFWKGPLFSGDDFIPSHKFELDSLETMIELIDMVTLQPKRCRPGSLPKLHK